MVAVIERGELVITVPRGERPWEYGRQVAVSGRLSHPEWQAGDGSQRSRLQVIAREVEFPV